MIFNFLLPYLAQLVIGAGIAIAAYLFLPRPKTPKPEVRDLESPTASAGRPIPYVVGTKTITSANVLWYGEKSTRQYSVKA